MSKRKTRKGPAIGIIEELLKQKSVYFGFHNNPVPLAVVESWQFRMVMDALKSGSLYYAMPFGKKLNGFPDDAIIHAEQRLKTGSSIEERSDLIDGLNNFIGRGADIDDVIDEYESWEDR